MFLLHVSHRILNLPMSVLHFRSFKQPDALSQPTCSNSLMADQRHSSECQEHQTDRNISKTLSPTCIIPLLPPPKSQHPGSAAPDFQRPRARCDGDKSDHFWKIHLCVSLRVNTKGPQHSKNTSVNILQLLKAIPGRHPFFICLSTYFERSLQGICFGCENHINIWVHVFVWTITLLCIR